MPHIVRSHRIQFLSMSSGGMGTTTQEDDIWPVVHLLYIMASIMASNKVDGFNLCNCISLWLH